MLPGCQPFEPMVSSTATQPFASKASVWARKTASVSSSRASRHDQPAAPGNSLAVAVRVARNASNAGPDAFSAPVGAFKAAAGSVGPPQVRPASEPADVASGSGSGDTGQVDGVVVETGAAEQASRLIRASAPSSPGSRPATCLRPH